MNKLIFLLLISFPSFAQTTLVSGKYREMKIAFDKETKYVTGFYEDGTGLDEKTNQPMFSCMFYLEGKLTGNIARIRSYFPQDSTGDLIIGELRVVNNKEFIVHLPEEHGGCWNVEHFADEPNDFKLDTTESWLQIRYITKGKTYFHSAQSEASKQKAYLVKGDIVCVEKIQGEWLFCSYYTEKKITKGWIRSEDLNQLN